MGRRSWKASSGVATPTGSAVGEAAARSASSTSSKGEVEYNRTVAAEVLSDEDKRHGACLSCRAVAVTDVTISLREETLRTVNPLMALYSASQADGLTHHPLHERTQSMAVMRMGYMHVKVTDLAEAKEHYANTVGLYQTLEQDGKVYYKGWDEWDHHSVVIEEGGVGFVRCGFKCERPEDIADIETKAVAYGYPVERMAAGENAEVGDGIRVTLPSRVTASTSTAT